MKSNGSTKASIGVGFLLLVALISGWFFSRSALRKSAEMRAQPHLDRAYQESVRVIDEHIKFLDTLFADAKKNTPIFAEEAMGWSSKLCLVVDCIPFTSKERQRRFIREKFEELIFKRANLETAMQQVVKSYLVQMRSIEGKMLVDLRADVADLPGEFVLAQMDQNKLQAAYDEAIAQATETAGSGIRADIATELASMITGEILTQVAVRLGVSAGVLGTGAASSWATFGISVVVGLIVDQIVSWVWDWWADPKGNLARDLNAKLDEIQRLIVDGSAHVKGMRVRLQEVAKDRAELRQRAVLALLKPAAAGRK